MSEKSVLSYYIYFCDYCLNLFYKDNEMEILSKLSTDYKYSECQFDFYIQEVIMKLIKNPKKNNRNE